MKRTRCPNGSRKDKNGVCVKKISEKREMGTCKIKKNVIKQLEKRSI